MELSRLAAKQKKIQNLNSLVEDYHASPDLREELSKLTRDYSTVLERSITSGSVSDPDLAAIRDIERQLDSLSEELRLFTHKS